jgi:hypothetical protein
MVAPVELVRELLRYRDMKVQSGRDWAFITAMIGGGSIAFPMLAPVALGSMAVLGVAKLRELRRRRAIAGIELPAPRVAPEARTEIGRARRFRSTVASVVDDGGQVLLEHAIVKDRAGGVLIRRSTSTSFLLDRGEAGPVLVTGALRLVAPGLAGTEPRTEPISRGDPRLRRMGVPSDLAIAGTLAVSALVESDLAIAVTGIVEDEAVAELAFHRDAGRIPVMRGQPGEPVIVQDCRLVGAALAR